MKAKTRYAYEKRIKELEHINDVLLKQQNELYAERDRFREVCSALYDAAINALESKSEAIFCWAILKRLKFL